MVRLNLHMVLADRRMQQKELSELTGISTNILSWYCQEKVKKVDLDYLNRICNTLDCDITDIIKYTKD